MKLPAVVTNILDSAVPTLKRFWVSVGFSVAATTFAIMLSSPEPFSPIKTLTRLMLASLLGVIVSWCAILIWEGKRSNSELTGNLIALPTSLLISTGIYIMLRETNFVTSSRYAVIVMFFALMFFVLPYTYRKDTLEMYFAKLFSHAVISVLFAAILYIGISGITFTISALFTIKMSYTVYLHIWLVMAGTVAPFLFMAGIPAKTNLIDVDDYPKTLKNLILYIITPLLATYTLILYAYFGKIIITRQWPVGLVSHLVLWYSLVSTAVLYFTKPLAAKNKWAEAFNKYFIKAVIPLLLMMFASMGIRIKAYGITENRYYVLVLGLWVLGSMLYLNISKSKRSTVLPASLAVVIILSMYGPWSSFSVSKWSQNQRLENISAEYDMIENGNIKKSTAQIAKEDQREIAEILFYFENYHSFSDINLLPDDFTMEKFNDTFGFSSMYYHYVPKHHFSYDIYNQSMDIGKYDYLFDFTKTVFSGEPLIPITQDNVEVIYNRETHSVSVILNGVKEKETSLLTYVDILLNKYGTDTVPELSFKDTSFTEDSANLSITLVIMGISGDTDLDYQDTNVYQVEFYVLVGIK